MTSPTGKVTTVRERKKASAGKKTKNKIRRTGTTAPNLALDKPNAHERSLAAAKKAAKK